MSGPYSQNYKSLARTVELIFENAIGITIEDEDSRLFPKKYRDMKFIFSIGNFFIRLLMINFCLVIIFYYYRKITVKRQVIEDLKEAKVKKDIE